MSDLQQTIFGQTELVGHRHQRMTGDYYPTPEGITRSLLNRVPITGTVFECCAGHGAVADILELTDPTERLVLQSDLSWPSPNGELRDATEQRFWEFWATLEAGGIPIDWTVTNPPFCEAEQILPLAWEYSRQGCAFLLRLSYLEPVSAIAQPGEILSPVALPNNELLAMVQQGLALLAQAQTNIGQAQELFEQVGSSIIQSSSEHPPVASQLISLSNGERHLLNLLALHRDSAIGKGQLERLSAQPKRTSTTV